MDNFQVIIQKIKLASGKRVRIIGILSVLAIVIALPLTITLVKQRQDIRQHASELPPPQGGALATQQIPPSSISAQAIGLFTDSPPSAVLDGNPATTWNSGHLPTASEPQWILLKFDTPRNIADVKLLIGQSPSGPTIHNLYLGTSTPPTDNASVLAYAAAHNPPTQVFNGSTTDRQTLEYNPGVSGTSVQGVTFLLVVTTSSPSFVDWRDISVFEAQTPNNLPPTGLPVTGVQGTPGAIPKVNPIGFVGAIATATGGQYIGGWACDPDDFSKPLQVTVYIDNAVVKVIPSADQATGNASYDASIKTACGNTTASHQFSFNIPVQFLDGNQHTIKAIATNIDSGADTELAAGGANALTFAYTATNPPGATATPAPVPPGCHTESVPCDPNTGACSGALRLVCPPTSPPPPNSPPLGPIGACMLRGQYEFDVTKSDGSVFHHIMTVQMTDPTHFIGTGYYVADNTLTWNITGTITGVDDATGKPTIAFHVAYTGKYVGYTSDSKGTINPDGTMSGTAVDSNGLAITWRTTNGNAICIEPPAVCGISPICPAGQDCSDAIRACPVNPGGQTQLAFDVLIHGIGRGGDNPSPNSIYNAPNHLNRNLQVQLISVNDPTKIINRSATLTYNDSSGSFTGSVTIDQNGCFTDIPPSNLPTPRPAGPTTTETPNLLPNTTPSVGTTGTPNQLPTTRPAGPTTTGTPNLLPGQKSGFLEQLVHKVFAQSALPDPKSACTPGQLANGTFQIRIKGDQTLGKIYPRAVTIQNGQINMLPQIALVTGDINGDNAVDMNDYNILYGCYSDFSPARSCSDTQKLESDLNDDGKVDGIDYNIFVRELSLQRGE